MFSNIPVRRALGATALAAMLLLVACAEPAPPPPAIPTISLSPRVIEQASAYRAYVARANTISPGFVDGAAVANSLKTGESYEPQQLLRGAIAYGAVVALQDPEFVAGVRKFVADPEQRRTVAYEIMKDPAYAVGFQGSAGAAGLVMAALGEDGRRLLDLGRSVKQAAYDVQHQSWSKADVPDRPGRLALAKSLSSVQQRPIEEGGVATLRLAATGTTPMIMSGAPAGPPYTPVVARALAVAAMASLGQGGEEYTEQLVGLLSEPGASTCLQMAKLNLYQCLAVSKPHYEDVFCLGQHILADTGQCVIRGAQVAVYVPPAPVALTPVADTQPVKKAPAKRAKKK